jgi:hypothetical protein
MTNNKQQTTLEWFAFELSKLGLLPDGVPDDIYKQAKEMEKERMKGMYVEGSFAKMRYYDGLEYIDAEQYYQETYGGNNEN